mgnify:CR=1 FL=1
MTIKHFSFYGRRYYLKLELTQSLIFLAIFILCTLLAVWQWQRAEESRLQEITRSESEVSKNKGQLTLSGHWLKASFLLDNRTHKGKVGYYHLGLFKPVSNSPTSNSPALLINLGWLQAPIIRTEIPKPNLAKDLQTISIANIPLTIPIVWSSDHWPSPTGEAWPKRIQKIDIERFQLASQQAIDPGYWKLVAGNGKLIDIFQSSPYLNKHKHLGYALQWLLIAIAALIVGFFSCIREYDISQNKSKTDI